MDETDTEQGTLIEQEVEEVASRIDAIATSAARWIETEILAIASLYQLAALAAALVLALLLRRKLSLLLTRMGSERALGSLVRRLIRTAAAITLPVAWAVGIWLAAAALDAVALPIDLLRLVGSLLNAFIAIRIATIFIPSAYWSAVFSWVVWSIAALNAVGLVDPVVGEMRATGMRIGEVEITLWTILKGALITAVLIWGASAVAEMIQKRLDGVQRLNAALRLLVGRLVRIGLTILAVVVGLTAVGVDLTAFAIFSGAVGIGVGLGLRQTISNMVASFSLLADNTLKPGDVIEVETGEGATYGVVRRMTTRYVSVRTRNGTEAIIPNDVLIANTVINWSHSDRAVRRKIPVGVSYATDLDEAIACCLAAAAACPRVLREPRPACLLKSFGESSLDLELRIWIEDPENGVSNVASEVMLEIWRRFREDGVEIPFPQRDVHLRTVDPARPGSDPIE